MKLSFENKQFTLSEINYDFLQVIINGIDCQRKRIVDKIAELNTHIFKGYSDDSVKEIKIQLEFLKEKNIELSELLDNLKNDLEGIDFLSDV